MSQTTLPRYGGRLVTLLTILGIGVVLLPCFWMVSSSLKTGAEVFELPIRWIPREPQWANYPNALSRGSFAIYFFNSAFVALAVMVGNLLFCSLAGYGLAKFRFPYRAFCFVLILSTLMLPLEIMLVPTFLVVRQLGLVNNYGGLIIPLAVDAFGIFLMRQYIKDLPDSLIEAARLDGCSEFGIFWRIILPNCKPALGALALLSFRDNWDQFLWPFIVASDDSLKTFPLGLAQMEGIDSAAYHEIMAIAVLGMIPAALIFLFFQRAFVRGIALSGLKE
jgi:multiple sugar transport system permease protein